MNADFYTRILSQLGNGIIMKNGDDSVTISSTDLIKTQAKMFDMQSCLLLEKASYLVLLMRYIISKSTNLFDKVHVCTDMEFVKNFTPPNFQAKNITPPISPNLNRFSKKKHKK